MGVVQLRTLVGVDHNPVEVEHSPEVEHGPAAVEHNSVQVDHSPVEVEHSPGVVEHNPVEQVGDSKPEEQKEDLEAPSPSPPAASRRKIPSPQN